MEFKTYPNGTKDWKLVTINTWRVLYPWTNPPGAEPPVYAGPNDMRYSDYCVQDPADALAAHERERAGRPWIAAAVRIIPDPTCYMRLRSVPEGIEPALRALLAAT